MALNQTLRPGLIQMRVLDLDKTLDFYKNILGLDEVTRTADGRVRGGRCADRRARLAAERRPTINWMRRASPRPRPRR